MKNLIFTLLTVFIFQLSVAQNARIKIDPERTIGEIDPLIYGNFVEHLGRCVYGGVYDPDSPLSDEDGFRKDVMQATKDLNVTITRYPGGNFVSNYHWLDGVGPERIPRLELAWYRLETNEFGTNEFAAWCKKAGTEPYFAVNLGTGTIEEAQHWVEYTNVASGPYYAELRKQHGYNEPHNIKYWSLGNEMDGPWQMGHLNAVDYAKKAREAAKLMKRTDPSIKLIAAGSSNYRDDANPDEWNAVVLNELRDVVDYIALHIYVGNRADNYYNYMATPLVMEERTEVVKGMILEEMQHTNREEPIYIAWDEYNVWYRARGGAAARGERALEEMYNLEDALVIGSFLNGFVRNADVVKMANMAQLVNVIGPMFTSENDMFRQTIFFPLELMANHMHGTSLDVFVDCEGYSTEVVDNGPGQRTSQRDFVPYLDVSAAINGDEVIFGVVNRHLQESITTDLITQEGSFTGKFEVYEVNGNDIKDQNDFDTERVSTTRQSDINAKGDAFTYTFPPHSFTLIKGKIKR